LPDSDLASLKKTLQVEMAKGQALAKEVVHVRYAVYKKGEGFLSHRRSSGGFSYQQWSDFEHARIWVREADAKRATWDKFGDPEKGVKVVPVTVALGKPFAIFTE
jgi:hypothetical protein